jgi:hypothetical protein
VATDLHHEEVFEIIGLDRTRKDMVILGALLKAQTAPNDFIDFETLRKQLASEEGSRKGKDPLIYRSLSFLEKEGFLKIDKGSYKHGYNSNIAIIEKALEKIISRNIKNLEKELKQIDEEATLLSEMDSDIMASGLIDFVAGKKKIEKSIFAQGWENILTIFDNKLYTNLKKGDVIRIKLEWLSHINYMDSKRVMNIEKYLKKGVEFQGLDHDKSEKRLRESYKSLIENWRKMGYNVGYRIFPRQDATYQFMGRGTEGIVLVVSESPLSATWISRNANPDLVDNAIESFDRDYEMGTDILDYEGE